MKAAFLSLGLALLASASPIGDRDLWERTIESSVPVSRSYALQSRVKGPASCASTTFAPVKVKHSLSERSRKFRGNRQRFIRRQHFSSAFIDVSDVWEALCFSSGHDVGLLKECLHLGGFNPLAALSVTADPCAQQDIADRLITFARRPGIRNADSFVRFAQAYRSLPRSVVSILGVTPSALFCQKAPVNIELRGVWNRQFNRVNHGVFGSPSAPLVAFGAPGTCPFGYKADINSCSCIDDSGRAAKFASNDFDDEVDESAFEINANEAVDVADADDEAFNEDTNEGVDEAANEGADAGAEEADVEAVDGEDAVVDNGEDSVAAAKANGAKAKGAANAEDANVDEADAEDANADDADAEDANAEEADAEDANAEDANVENADAEDANVEEADAEKVDAEDANAEDANADEAANAEEKDNAKAKGADNGKAKGADNAKAQGAEDAKAKDANAAKAVDNAKEADNAKAAADAEDAEKTEGANVQPDDISGDVNDPAGR